MVRSAATAGERRRLTVDEVQRMEEVGILHEDDHVELLDGGLYQRAAMNGPHVSCVIRLTRTFDRSVLGDRAMLSVQSAIRLSEFSAPEPDIALVRYREDFYASALPTAADILLIVEVADTTLGHDRTVKLPLYAAAGIPEVWNVDVRRRRVTVYRDPSPDGYRPIAPHARRAPLSPLALPNLTLRWEDIFGRE